MTDREMTTDDLVKRLRDLGDRASFQPHMHHTAADHIEALQEDVDRLTHILTVAVFMADPYNHNFTPCTLKRIHVNQHKIRRKEAQVLSIKNRGSTTVADEVEIKGPSTVVYRPDKPLSCGARVWVETRAPIVVDGKETIE